MEATNQLRAFVSHGGNKPSVDRIEKFLGKLGVESIRVAERASGGREVRSNVAEYEQQSQIGVVIWTKDVELKDGRWIPSANVHSEEGALRLWCEDRVIYLMERGVDLQSLTKGIVYEAFSDDDMSPAFEKIVTELREWGYLRVWTVTDEWGSSSPDSQTGPHTAELLGEDGIYDKTILDNAGLKELLVYVPVGLWAFRGERDRKVEWILAIQARLREQQPGELWFEGAYGLPPRDSETFDRVEWLLSGFAGCINTTIRVFPAAKARVVEDDSRDVAAIAPGLGNLLAKFSDKRIVLFGWASKPESVRIDAAARIVATDIHDSFEHWYRNHVAKVGHDLLVRYKTPEQIAREIRAAAEDESN